MILLALWTLFWSPKLTCLTRRRFIIFSFRSSFGLPEVFRRQLPIRHDTLLIVLLVHNRRAPPAHRVLVHYGWRFVQRCCFYFLIARWLISTKATGRDPGAPLECSGRIKTRSLKISRLICVRRAVAVSFENSRNHFSRSISRSSLLGAQNFVCVSLFRCCIVNQVYQQKEIDYSKN